MPQKIYHSVNTFNAGEVSDLIFNREDISKYKSSCRVLENAFPLVEGGAQKMPGTYFAGPTGNQSNPCRLIPFQFSTLQGAILELSATGIHGGMIRIWEPSAPGVWSLVLVDSAPNTPLTLATPYLQDELFQLDCGTQSADVLWIFHPGYPPACVERLGPSSWQYTLYPPGGPTNNPLFLSELPPYRGTPDVVSTGFSGLGVPISQISVANPAVLQLAEALNPVGLRVYINLCTGMVELNEGEFYLVDAGTGIIITPAKNGAVFDASISGTTMTVTAVLVALLQLVCQ